MLQQFAKFSLVEMLLILLSGATIKMEASLLNRLTRWEGRFKGKIGQNHQVEALERRSRMHCGISESQIKLKSLFEGHVMIFFLQELIVKEKNNY